MNKSESKYHNSSLLMNEALLELLNKKEYEFITIKEICKKAGVNRSTFYLHYDNVDDLLYETIDNLNKEFFSCFAQKDLNITQKIQSKNKNELILVSPTYLIPYLNHVKKHKVVYQISVKHPIIMKSIEKYNYLEEKILFPIFNSFNIEQWEKKYFSAYFIKGTFAIVEEWIKNGCEESEEKICQIIMKCVPTPIDFMP